MTVVNTEEDAAHFWPSCEPDRKCTVCRGQLMLPFLAWLCEPPEPSVLICPPCCRKIKTGLVADLIQVAAISELSSLGEPYSKETLVRENLEHFQERCRLEQRQAEQEEENRIVRMMKDGGKK